MKYLALIGLLMASCSEPIGFSVRVDCYKSDKFFVDYKTFGGRWTHLNEYYGPTINITNAVIIDNQDSAIRFAKRFSSEEICVRWNDSVAALKTPPVKPKEPVDNCPDVIVY